MSIARRLANAANRILARYGVRISRTTVSGTGLENAATIAIKSSRSKNPVVLDIGANNGGFSEKLLERHPHIQVFAFEPNPMFRPELERLSRKYSRFKPFLCALGSDEGRAILNIANAVDASSLLQFTDDYKEKYRSQSELKDSVEIEIDTLDRVMSILPMEEPICLLKMDVQGFEGEVIQGARETLKRTKYLVTEACLYPTYADGIMIDEISVLLRYAGFKLVWGFDVFPASLDLFWKSTLNTASENERSLD